MDIVLVLLLSYLVGSIPFGILISRAFNINILEVGSGNIGATNVLRSLGAGPAALVLLFDMLKGAFAVYLAVLIINSYTWIIAAGLMAVIGHMYSVFLKFKGGKGIATGLGVLLGIAPDLFVITLIVGIAVIVVTRYVSLGSLTGAVVLPILMFASHKPPQYAWTTVVIGILIVIRHIPNIKRLTAGTENKIGEKAP